MKKTFIIHPFLFAIFPILFLFSYNIEQMMSFSETLAPAAVVLGFTLLLLLISKLIFKDNKKAGIIISAFLVLFFSYGHVFDMIQGQVNLFLVGKHGYLIFIWGLLLTSSIYFIAKTRRDLRNFNNILNIIAFSLVVISLISIGAYKFKTRNIWQDNNRNMEAGETNIANLVNTDIPRDIYYIILDEYAPQSTLKEIFNYDNHEFTDYLTEKGFTIASKSRSNYALTYLSLSSSLNMTYINRIINIGIVGIESRDKSILNQTILENRVAGLLQSKGYQFVDLSSGWGKTSNNPYADLNLQCHRWSRWDDEFTAVLIKTTMLRPFEEYFIEDTIRANVLCTFDRLAKIYKIKGPKFVFAHIVSPHEPYVFGPDGEKVSEVELKMSEDEEKQKEKYLNQLIFINKKVKVLVDEILSNSEIPPIIILQADHGTASTFDITIKAEEYPIDENMYRERMRIFNAYYLPQGGNDVLFDSITPVNTFRLIFNLYFGMNYELLPEQNYFSNNKTPYKLIDVTDIVGYD